MHAGDFPDPSILQWGGVYYGFATQNFAAPSQTINIQVSTSLDGVNWTPLTGVDALPTVGVVGRAREHVGTQRRPRQRRQRLRHVLHRDGGLAGDQCIGVATSLTPLGPYPDTQSQPVVCQNGVGYSDPDRRNGNYGGSIDPTSSRTRRATPG